MIKFPEEIVSRRPRCVNYNNSPPLLGTSEWRGCCFMYVLPTQHFGQRVERQTLVAADGEAFVVMVPRGKQQQLTSGTGFHALARGFGQFRKTVLLQDDEWVPFFEGCPHDVLLTLGNAGRYEHRALTGQRKALLRLSLYLFVGQAA